MDAKPLCIRALGEALRVCMYKKCCVKKFDSDKKSFEGGETVNLSQIYAFYAMLLDALVYFEPDFDGSVIDSKMTSNIKNGKDDVPNEIAAIAERDGVIAKVADYLEVNLIPNITKTLLPVALDRVEALVWNDTDLGNRKRRSLKEARKKKRESDYIAEVLVLAVLLKKNTVKDAQMTLDTAKSLKYEVTSELSAKDILKETAQLLGQLPAPAKIEPPPEFQPFEMVYIAALFAAYGNAEGIEGFGTAELKQFGEYAEDLEDRRVDYFAAETIRRGLSELDNPLYEEQFDELKDAVYDGVKDTARSRRFENAFERMLKVMEKAVSIDAADYLFEDVPKWSGGKVKKGVCHFLVSDGKLEWVRK